MREITKLNLLRTLRATGAFSFIPEGRTYSPLVTQAVVSFPKVRLVRSPRGMRHLRMPMEDTASRYPPRSWSAVIASPNTVASIDVIPPTARIKLPPAALFAVMTVISLTVIFSFAKEKQKTRTRGR